MNQDFDFRVGEKRCKIEGESGVSIHSLSNSCTFFLSVIFTVTSEPDSSHHNLMLLPNCSPANDPLKTNEIPSIILYFETIKTRYN